jgi:hypothetical protein
MGGRCVTTSGRWRMRNNTECRQRANSSTKPFSLRPACVVRCSALRRCLCRSAAHLRQERVSGPAMAVATGMARNPIVRGGNGNITVAETSIRDTLSIPFWQRARAGVLLPLACPTISAARQWFLDGRTEFRSVLRTGRGQLPAAGVPGECGITQHRQHLPSHCARGRPLETNQPKVIQNGR